MKAATTALLALLAIATAVPFAAAQRDGAAAADAVELEPLTVHAPPNPLEDSLDLLRVLVEETTPCLGCGTVLRQETPAMLTLLESLLWPSEPPQVDEATRLAREVKLQDAPDLDYLPR